MQRFKNILYVNVPGLDPRGTPQRAAQLARNNRARLTFCDVHNELPRSFTNLGKTFKNLHRQQLAARVESYAIKDVDIRIRMLTGTPFMEIVREVIRGGYDLVIKPAEGTHAALGGLFGSTDMNLLRKCPCPVWIMKASKRKKYARILAAVDPDPEIAANAELNKLILDLATALAQQEQSELHIVHTWSLPYENLLRSRRTPLKKAEVTRLVRDQQLQHRAWLDDLLDAYQLDEIQHKVHLLKGEPGRLIPALASRKRAELIVMGTLARTGVPGFFIGNTAEKILAAVDCSVLTVKPAAFSSPVKP